MFLVGLVLLGFMCGVFVLLSFFFDHCIGFSSSIYEPITNTAWVRARLCKLQKKCTRLAAASAQVYQLLAHGRWFSPGTPASSTTKSGRHDIAEILLKVALKQKNQNQSSIYGLWLSLWHLQAFLWTTGISTKQGFRQRTPYPPQKHRDLVIGEVFFYNVSSNG